MAALLGTCRGDWRCVSLSWVSGFIRLSLSTLLVVSLQDPVPDACVGEIRTHRWFSAHPAACNRTSPTAIEQAWSSTGRRVYGYIPIACRRMVTGHYSPLWVPGKEKEPNDVVGEEGCGGGCDLGI
ncbi:hypothetical protein FRB95_007434 [Tulasnella sp. JGI-2019a]|nr:hypothetical protein FRB95_007434 [Tulasnella sp. JGI-2019a]